MRKIMMLTNSSGLSITDGKSAPLTIANSHPRFKEIFEKIQADEVTIAEVRSMMDFKEQLNFEADGIQVRVENDKFIVIVDGQERHNVPQGIKKRVIETLKAGTDVANFNLNIISKFLVRLYKNPSFQVVDQLYRFITANDLPLTQDGTFLAYKKIGFDYKDLYTGTMDNSVGKTLEMIRSEVRDDPNVTCAEGLHVASKSYLEHYGSNDNTVSRIVIVEVDPVDVVSVPTDYNNAKMRVCKYKVVDELTDFDVDLASYVVGRHEEGWITNTLNKIKTFYTEFWNLSADERFTFGEINRKGFITPAVVDDFLTAANETFPDLVKYDVDIINDFDAGIQVMFRPILLFQMLSRFDSQSLRTAKE